jgi:hypothetical protein
MNVLEVAVNRVDVELLATYVAIHQRWRVKFARGPVDISARP